MRPTPFNAEPAQPLQTRPTPPTEPAARCSLPEQVLIFSHSRRMLRIIESFVVRQGHDYLYMDGETAVKERQGLVDTFNARPSLFLFLISTLAGGTGLNLTGANK